MFGSKVHKTPIVLLLIIINYKLYSDDIKTNLAIKAGGSVGHSSEEFFDKYFQEINRSTVFTPESGLGPAFIFSVFARYNVYQDFKIAFGVERFQLSFNERFSRDFANTGQFAGFISEDIRINENVFNLNLEYRPYSQMQFRSYFGGGLLLSRFDMLWRENIEPIPLGDLRTGGIVYDEVIYKLGFTFYSGVELDFDRYYVKNLFRGLILELKVNYNPKNDQFFEFYKGQFRGKDEVFDSKVGLNNLYLLLSFGLNLDLYHNKASQEN